MNSEYLLIVVIVLAIYLIVGIFPYSKSNRENYLISGRKLKGFSNGFSIAASKIGGGLLVTYSTLFFAFGWSAFFYFIGIVIGYIFFYIFAFRLVDESKTNNYYTIADYFTAKFGKKVGLLIGLLTTLSVLGWVFTNLIAGGVLLSNLTHLSSLFTTITLALVIGSYLCIGGFDSVVKTDIIQYIALIIITVVFSLVLVAGNFKTKEVITTTIPIGQIIGFIFLGILFPMGSGELWQRIYASESKKEFKKSLIIASSSYVFLGVILSIICFKVLSISSSSLPDKDELKLALGVENIVKDIHPLLPFVWLIAYLSAIISSADTFVYTTASSIVQDLFQKSGKVKDDKVVSMIKVSIIALLIFGIIISKIYPEVANLTFLFLGISLVISSLAYFSRKEKLKENAYFVLISGIIGLLSVFIHFGLLGFNADTWTSLIGCIMSFIVLLISLLWLKYQKN